MIRFSWLQTRTQTVVSTALLGALVVAAWVTGVQLSHLYHSLVAHCTLNCGLSTNQFLGHDHFMSNLLDILARAVPAILGLFWGAPLLTREFEAGTYRLAWTQGVTRTRWILTKLGLGALVTILISGALTLTITWWYRALDPVASNKYAVFDRRDIVPIAYALFAFFAGTLIGAIVRRTVPAMAATLAAFVFGRVAVSLWLRPHLLHPVTTTQSTSGRGDFGIASTNGRALEVVGSADGPQNSWALSSHILTSSGQPTTDAMRAAFLQQHCPSLLNQFNSPPLMGRGGGSGTHVVAGPAPEAARACLAQAAHAFKFVVTYLPPDRYWALQWAETGVFGALALLCAAGTFWWVTRRAN